MVLLQGFIQGVFFLTELAALAGFGFWGFHAGANTVMKVLLGIGTPLLVAVFWGMFVAPKANYPVTPLPRAALQALVFGLSAWSLRAAGQPALALIFIVIALAEVTLSYCMKL
ncbi:YrdB family protein [Cohnella sp. AR92]|uniref:YrdB family protein n=1 Tax=Cohnella sp. AR92 TaxID=648716 RepID=UPI00131588E1|nr:YrdB family protein [Cohnella sp. AR92]